MDGTFGAGGGFPQNSTFPQGGAQHQRAGARESDLDRLQSALEKAETPRTQPLGGTPLSQSFDPNAYLLELDGVTLDSLRRSSQQAQPMGMVPMPGFGSYPQQTFGLGQVCAPA